MIRKLSGPVMLTALLTLPAQADTLLGLTAGVDLWDMDSSGSFADTSEMQSFDLGSERTAVLSLALEHPLPLVPNFKIRTNDLSSSADETLAETFSYSGVDFPAGAEVTVDFDIQNTDFVLYYELLDNDTVSFDLGLNVKYLDGKIRVENTGLSAQESFTGYVPMLYGAIQLGIPSTRLSLYGDLNLLSVGDHTLQDYQAGVAFGLVENLAVDIKLRGGYRRISLELEDLDGIYTDWTFDGMFLGLEADF
ncbi:MAG: TIGR04219 family outer membrane beta-barrel protein [Candidatus Thiodiazotropha sp. (ex Epidulcina cf. delphinae)]|nr:TIGR04219 family outer membrane beta-barrel protein [Candidatus Thiodiazotropha sp. (ex Epidulcina cf. delphinae)]